MSIDIDTLVIVTKANHHGYDVTCPFPHYLIGHIGKVTRIQNDYDRCPDGWMGKYRVDFLDGDFCWVNEEHVQILYAT